MMFGGETIAAEKIIEVVDLQNRPAAEILPLLQPMLEDGDQAVDNDFRLIVKTSPARLASLRQLIAKLDIRQRNLLISVLQNSVKSAAELNAEAALILHPDRIQMQGYQADTRYLDHERTLQQIRTLEGQPAHIETGEQRPIQNQTLYANPYGYPAVGYNTQLQTASTGFAVTPRLIGATEVAVDIEPWSEHFLRGGTIEQRNAATSLRARLGEWIEIASSGEQRQAARGEFLGMNQQSRNDQFHVVIKIESVN